MMSTPILIEAKIAARDCSEYLIEWISLRRLSETSKLGSDNWYQDAVIERLKKVADVFGYNLVKKDQQQ